MTNNEQPQRYILIHKDLRSGKLRSPLILDRETNYNVLLKMFDEDPDSEIVRKYENVDTANYNAASRISVMPEGERKEATEGLIRTMDKLQGVTA